MSPIAIIGIILAAVLSLAASLISGLVLLNLTQLNKRAEDTARRIEAVEAELKPLANKKTECQKDFVDKVDFIREVTYQRRVFDQLLQGQAKIDGKMDVIDKMPQICGSIAKEIVREMKEPKS